ncbi:MAG: SDR family oxidoreductase [Alphaproteobacteria bacterium]|nr:SDR family oxidoreductase [Alphaproteobacteria bacterium]
MGDRLKDKVALVVGAGSIGPGWGNGKATAVLFAREGARIVAVDINRAAAEETCAIIRGEGGEAEPLEADVSKSDQVRKMVNAARGCFGRIDVLHNNVGIVSLGGPVETEEKDWDRVHDVNLKSFYLTCKHVLPHMERQGGGAIVNISSVASIRWTGVPYLTYYTTKAAINQLTVAVAMQYARKNIRCNAVLPGLMNTPMVHAALPGHYAQGDVDRMIAIRDAQCPTGKMGDAWDVAHASLFLASDEARYVTGHCLVVDGGLTCKFA